MANITTPVISLSRKLILPANNIIHVWLGSFKLYFNRLPQGKIRLRRERLVCSGNNFSVLPYMPCYGYWKGLAWKSPSVLCYCSATPIRDFEKWWVLLLTQSAILYSGKNASMDFVIIQLPPSGTLNNWWSHLKCHTIFREKCCYGLCKLGLPNIFGGSRIIYQTFFWLPWKPVVLETFLPCSYRR